MPNSWSQSFKNEAKEGNKGTIKREGAEIDCYKEREKERRK
jgi:hypothetical protein